MSFQRLNRMKAQRLMLLSVRSGKSELIAYICGRTPNVEYPC